jgi:cyclophilin family peptidyl-prolyl cis-trans isomerase/HEAT repeat protein
MRELAVDQLKADDRETGPVLARAVQDLWPEVRVRALRRIAEAIPRTRRCALLLGALHDGAELAMVKIEALGLLDARCEEREAAARIARDYSVSGDSRGPPAVGWPIRARAIETLALLDPALARESLEAAAADVWQVRAARARAAATLRANERLRAYAEDEHPNVRTEALNRLFEMGDSSATGLALKALSNPDYQLVMAGARIVGLSKVPREAALVELWSAFRRLTTDARDASRYPRLEILEVMKAWAPAHDNVSPVQFYVDDLRTALSDIDPIVAETASEVLQTLTTIKFPATPTFRPPRQPDEVELTNLPVGAAIDLDSGDSISISFLRLDAPLAVARFVSLVKAGYYRDQTFAYQVLPLVAVHGGSPDGNELSGDARFLRDEISLHRRQPGMIGLLSHGRDTADGRLFVDLSEQPSTDYQHTLFARIGALRTAEGWGYGVDPFPPPAALVRGGTITLIQLIYR